MNGHDGDDYVDDVRFNAVFMGNKSKVKKEKGRWTVKVVMIKVV